VYCWSDSASKNRDYNGSSSSCVYKPLALCSWLPAAAMIPLSMNPLVEHLWHIIRPEMPLVHRLLPPCR
jgi:hypothetical protein